MPRKTLSQRYDELMDDYVAMREHWFADLERNAVQHREIKVLTTCVQHNFDRYMDARMQTQELRLDVERAYQHFGEALVNGGIVAKA